MKKKNNWIRGIIAAAVCAAALILAGCGTTSWIPPGAEDYMFQQASNRSERKMAIERARPIRTEPAQRPGWIDEIPVSSRVLNFVGTSLRFATSAQARNNAQEDGRRQLVDYYGTLMVNKGREYAATYGISNQVFAPQIAGQQLNERMSQNVAQALEARSFYTQVFLDETHREAYEVNVLMEIDKARVAKAINDYGKEVAEDLTKKAAAEQDAQRRKQMEKAAEFFGGNLSSTMGF